MSKDPGRALVIGASNLDIKGQTNSYHIAKTSNPGLVRNSAGGVGRNISENLARLGVKTTLLSVVGNDVYGKEILEITSKAGVDLSHLLVAPDMHTGIFLAILNHYGDLESAIADLDAIQLITPTYIKENIHLFDDATFVVLDADIPIDSMLFCLDECAHRNIPVCVEPISVARSQQILHLTHKITMVTPNREEAEVLAGFPLRSADDVKRAGAALLAQGLKWVIITLGPEGVLIAEHVDGKEDMIEFLPSISTMVADTVGAGDALTSGTICGIMEGLDFKSAVQRGIVCATLTLQTKLAVHPELSKERIASLQ